MYVTTTALGNSLLLAYPCDPIISFHEYTPESSEWTCVPRDMLIILVAAVF